MITNRWLFFGLPLGAVVIALVILASLQWRSSSVVIEAGFWFDDVTFEISPLDVQQIGGPIDDGEKAMIRKIAQDEVESAYASLRMRFSENRRAYHRVRVVQGPLEDVSKMSRGAAGQTTAWGPMGGDSTVSFYVLERGAFAYAPSQASRQDILEGIGRGIGRTAVHELAHQLLGRTTSTHSRDDRSYEYGSPDRIGQYYGPIHWSTAWEPLQRRLGREADRRQKAEGKRQKAKGRRQHGRTELIRHFIVAGALVGLSTFAVRAQQPTAPAPPPPGPKPTTRADILRGEYGQYRANNDLLSYKLDVRVNPDAKFISGKNSIRFRMLSDDSRIQLDLYANLTIDQIAMGTTPLTYTREVNAVFIDFPETLKKGREYTIDFSYSGNPLETGRFGGIAFRKDPAGRHWINTACEGEGSSIWWPSKDQWRDEVESMEISVSIPNDLVDVSNGRFVGKTDLGDGYTRWDWRVHYPINSYNVSLNIGHYEHFADRLGDLTLDFYALPENLDKAKTQFAQAKPMIEAYQKYFGEYPFAKDGYKLVEAPYSGMEHQSAVTYGNHFMNGYLERDWTGVGVSMKFDFIIIHESGHEWFGNAVSAADVSDMWIHEGWTTYLECLYVEHMFGYDDALKYTNGYKPKIRNTEPIITPRGIHRTPPGDQYFKGALFLNTLRNVVNDDNKWFVLIHDVFQHFKYQNIMTEDLVAFVNQKLGWNATPLFDQYLRHADIPTLELRFDTAATSVSYRWKADEKAFAMPIRVGQPQHWEIITPTTEWKTMKTPLARSEFQVATDLYYVNVAIVEGA